MKLTRRDALTLGLGATAASLLPTRASSASADAIAEFTHGAEIGLGDMTLHVPSKVSVGAEVPIQITATGAVCVLVLATENPRPNVATFSFGPMLSAQTVTTRIRLSKTQDIIAIAKMDDGRFVKSQSKVAITQDL
ncbi:sulfur-oxidizing protein SoxY [Pacificibacter maritimus]|uniref:Sulfur-oxidizing protein SoxY n=1 Tax=Pacificibacter maritimus TaxID=762213 RepID=A0A3N4UMC4_9RHOB|nr:thiosulfate oxidation carrier protein SoxY [Pacificibacter maritimus]RPE71158.1 sulfur-oxidizing protein SoxY [Pacificibacter maritimus]